MRLAEFVLANVEPILAEWEMFARRIWPDPLASAGVDASRVRDHAEAILRATVQDMLADQTARQQSEKSKGDEQSGVASGEVNLASGAHGSSRVGEGFELWAIVAEYRALRASVIRLWRESGHTPDLNDLDDLTRFNESIDQSLTGAIRSFTEQVKRDREALLDRGQEAESANRAKEIFLATLSHEMRTPLNAIVGWINILRTRREDTKDLIQEGLDVIERNTKAQVQLIEDVLDVSAITSGQLRLAVRNCDLREAINAGVEAMRPAAKARGISIDVQLEPEASQALCDPVRFQQIVWNLVSNAIKFSSKDGSVCVTLVREGPSSKLTVSDNGKGIRADQLPYIFDRFQQADRGTRRKYGGLGLGLSIVKHLVAMHGGTVEVHSEGENRGSTFTVRIPAHVNTVVETVARLRAETPSSGESAFDALPTLAPVRLDGLRVLVVDDEPDARRMLSQVLEGVGAHVTVADDAAKALKELALGDDGFDVLVSDLAMPDQDGFDLIREVRQRGHDARMLPAVALTGFAYADDVQHAIAAGFQRHLAKPVDVHDLTAIIASLVGRTA